MFYIAWKYALVVLFGFGFVQVFTNITNARIGSRDEDLAQKVNMLESKSKQQIASGGSLAQASNQFGLENDEILKKSRRNSTVFGCIMSF